MNKTEGLLAHRLCSSHNAKFVYGGKIKSFGILWRPPRNCCWCFSTWSVCDEPEL